jgi:hypothetical protein
MSTLFLRFDENIFMRSRRVDHSSFNDDENNDDDDDENDVENDDEDSNARQKNVDADLEENKNDIDVESFKKSFEKKIESTNDQKNDVIELKKNEKNDEVKSTQNDVDENRALNNNFSSDFFNFEEKEIVSFVIFQRRVVSKSTFDSKFTFDFRRNSRRSSQTSFEKEKRSIFSEDENVESSLKRRRRSEF